MNIKDSIGLRIKTERERQQMSREVLCLDGAELTVRQLIRIEKGESLPSLDKLSYIAKRLGKNPDVAVVDAPFYLERPVGSHAPHVLGLDEGARPP